MLRADLNQWDLALPAFLHGVLAPRREPASGRQCQWIRDDAFDCLQSPLLLACLVQPWNGV